jgi:hypothetical protein
MNVKNKLSKRVENRDVTIYTCSDGMEFDAEYRAVDHEEYLTRVRIESKTRKESFPVFLGLYSTWSFIGTKDERDFYSSKDETLKGLKLGDWFTEKKVWSETEYGHEVEIRYIILRELLADMKRFIKAVESKTVDGQY